MFTEEVRHRDWIIGVVATALVVAGLFWFQTQSSEAAQEVAQTPFEVAAVTNRQ